MSEDRDSNDDQREPQAPSRPTRPSRSKPEGVETQPSTPRETPPLPPGGPTATPSAPPTPARPPTPSTPVARPPATPNPASIGAPPPAQPPTPGRPTVVSGPAPSVTPPPVAPPQSPPASSGFDTTSTAPHHVGKPAPTTPAPSASRGSRKGLFIGGGIVALALVAGGAFAIGRNGGDTDAVAPTTTSVVSTTAPDSASTAPEVTDNAAPPPADEPPSVAMLAASTVQIQLLDADGRPVCSGSGTVVDSDGTILTNAHVIARDEFCPFSTIGVAVTEDSGRPPALAFEADLLVADVELDLAVIRIARTIDGAAVTDPGLPALPVGDSDSVVIGEDIRILGYPSIGGDTITFTNGSVSGFTAQAGLDERAWIKTDATIAGGNSGGTAVNNAGELIGVPTQAAATVDGPVVDCRVLADTNGDGRIDRDDQCIPIGGFLNGIRPVNLALPLLEEARTATPMQFEDAAPPTPDPAFEPSDVVAYGPSFSLGIGDPLDDTSFVVSATSQETELCVWFNWFGVPDGTVWDAVWLVDGEINETYSVFGQIWDAGTDGFDYWVCAINEDGLDAGLYEMVWFVSSEIVFAEAMVVTNDPLPVFTVIFENQSDSEICFLLVNPAESIDLGLDELLADERLAPGDTTEQRIPEGPVIFDAQDCTGRSVTFDVDGVEIDTEGQLIALN